MIARQRARISARWPSSGIMKNSSGRYTKDLPLDCRTVLWFLGYNSAISGRRLEMGFTGSFCLLQGFCDFRWHVVFIVFGEHLFGDQHALLVDPAQCHNALPFPEQVRQDTGVADGNAGLIVG